MSQVERAAADAAKWLNEQAARVAFGAVSTTLILHAGRVSRIERTVTVKEQPDEGRDRADAGR